MTRTAEDFLKAIKDILYPGDDPEAEWSSDELPMIAEVIQEFYSNDKPHAEFPCWCEHANHAPDKWCHESSQFGAYSDWVGNVCPSCAKGCLPDYIIWPTAVHDGREVFSLSLEKLAEAQALFPSTYFPVLPTDEGRVRTLMTLDQAGLMKGSS
jgi:hypothetical protein